MFTLKLLNGAKPGIAFGRSFVMRALYVAIAPLAILLVNCGGGNGNNISPGATPPPIASGCTNAISNATGKWVTVVNNTYTPPDATDKHFFSYNQPSVNSNGEVVFRARAKAAGGAAGGEPHRGVWAVDLCKSSALQTVVDTTMAVPAPNNQIDPVTGLPAPAIFNETPSIPRIDISSPLIATRGNSSPVWTYIDPTTGSETKGGTTGIFTWMNGPLTTGVDTLGNVPEFSYFQVPGAPPGTKFDVFPGSPTMSSGKYIAFKGNYTVDEIVAGSGVLPVSKTGVYFRDISVPASRVILIANSSTMIPGQTVPFGSTAPPSAAAGKIVFTGLDNEDNPTKGGIYVAPLVERPPFTAPSLTAIAQIGEPVPDRNGVPLVDGSTFTTFGEGLSYDGRYVAFWGAWGADKRNLDLVCPADGNKDRIAYCKATAPLPGYITRVQVPVNQGIFLHDTVSGKTLMVARSGIGEPFDDFLYWVYSGRPPGTGSTPDDSDGEPPRWRSSAFAAVDGTRGVIFKASRSAISGVTVPSSGIYAAGYVNGALSDVVPVIEVGNLVATLDPGAPPDSTVLSVGIEREALRNGWVTLTMSSINPAGESWAGIYATHVSALVDIPPTD
ncbi:MAG TPA: hypothetical protein VMV70_03620 [Gallionella sp.]|nr:hypothetical protein [Gallionella sp.]